jgi:hypothetical protein
MQNRSRDSAGLAGPYTIYDIHAAGIAGTHVTADKSHANVRLFVISRKNLTMDTSNHMTQVRIKYTVISDPLSTIIAQSNNCYV